MTHRRKWLTAIPAILLFGLGIPWLVAGDFVWFLGTWSDTVFVLLILGMWTAAAAFVDPARGNRAFSRSRLFISLGLILVIPASVLERTQGPGSERDVMWSIAGMVLCALAIPLGITARRVLGSSYVPDPQILPGQRLVAHGPYRYLRHPLYTAALVWCTGLSLVIRSMWGIGIMGATLLPAMLIRIREEEAMLLGEFGDEYRAYARKTWRLLPYVW